MSNLFLWISKNNFLDKSYKILYPWMVVGVGAGNISTTTGCAACGLALHPGRVRPDYNQPTKVSRQVTCCLVKLQVHDTSASTPSPPLSNLTPDPLQSIKSSTQWIRAQGLDEASDYTISIPAIELDIIYNIG